MYMETTIRLSKSVKRKLDSIKIHPNESYNDAISRMLQKDFVSLDKESLIETIEVLSDPELMSDLRESLSKTSPGIPLEEFEKRLGL